MDAFQVVKEFEKELAEYTGAPFVVVVNSCTSAIQLALEGLDGEYQEPFCIPRKTYRSVANMIVRAGFNVSFCDQKDNWSGSYQIKPTPIWDCALMLEPGMYRKGTIQCLSFHPQKPLALSCGGGAILHDDRGKDIWYRWQRFDGREEGIPIQKDLIHSIGAHCYMFPGQAAEGLQKLAIYKARGPVHIPHPDYEDLWEKW